MSGKCAIRSRHEAIDTQRDLRYCAQKGCKIEHAHGSHVKIEEPLTHTHFVLVDKRQQSLGVAAEFFKWLLRVGLVALVVAALFEYAL